jgi:hypothetical protein
MIVDFLRLRYIFFFRYHCQYFYRTWLYVDFFLFSITANMFTGFDCIYEYMQHGGCRIRSRNCLLFASTWVHTRFLVGPVFLIFLVFCVVFLFSLSSSSCIHCYQCLWIVHSWFALRFSFSFVKCKRSVTEIFIFTSYIYTIVIEILPYHFYYGDMSYLQVYKVFENIAYILYLTDILSD